MHKPTVVGLMSISITKDSHYLCCFGTAVAVKTRQVRRRRNKQNLTVKASETVDFQLQIQGSFCWLLARWVTVNKVMRSTRLCFLPVVFLTVSADLCCTPPPHLHLHPTHPLKVPNTQKLNENSQISHVDLGKIFQYPGPGQQHLAEAACAVLQREKPTSLFLGNVDDKYSSKSSCWFTSLHQTWTQDVEQHWGFSELSLWDNNNSISRGKTPFSFSLLVSEWRAGVTTYHQTHPAKFYKRLLHLRSHL